MHLWQRARLSLCESRYGQLAETEFVHWPSAKVGLDDDAGTEEQGPEALGAPVTRDDSKQENN